jgi:iron complex transport system permease protein
MASLNEKKYPIFAEMYKKSFFAALFLLLIVSVFFSISTGSVSISFSEIFAIVMNLSGIKKVTTFTEQQEVVLLFIRLPRVCLSLLIGSGLAMAGALMQGLFRNPLADPGLIGISSGASLFAVITIVMEIKLFQHLSGLAGVYTLSFMAFAGACLTTLLVYQIAKISGQAVISTLLLAGIALNALAGSLTSLISYWANAEQIRSLTFWGLGSLGGATWTTVAGVAPFVIVAACFTPYLAKSLNVLALGESQAIHLGINPVDLRRKVIILATLVVGASVAAAGIIGFVGLLVPHLIRQFTGADNRKVLPASMLGGAVVLTFADTTARILIAPAELPIGILTALLGTPVFLWMLIQKKAY